MEEEIHKEIKNRIIRLKMIDGTTITGQVNINREPGYDRLSDMVVSYREPFLVLFSVTVYHKDMDTAVHQKTLFINKNHILWATPEEDQ
ncbi:MAG: hypothetical protein D3926_13480 [Desulfobacteraceae bacterium]|nr:MAG: hypothetical protein D3926_13480 [Desulfobacteraceae bacterium]